ncbi:MAG: hypothetical protein EPN79_10995 [Burkholderiaceae bacterium]|nr:MAG: hypothetical protein EPN79_10995 [Burkholderiaceae bacterium]TBR76790.1 MAG: hypothetical protein EPN64_06080 [Burkholderiaceae bacterium]
MNTEAVVNKGGNTRLAAMLGEMPLEAGPEFSRWLVERCQSGVRQHGPGGEPAYKPLKDRPASDILSDDNMQEMCRMLSRHPGAPMAFAGLCMEPSLFHRLRDIVAYVNNQSMHPDVSNASDQGSCTAYVSPMHINEVMRSYEVDDEDQAELEITRIRAAAREQVMQGLLRIAQSSAVDALASFKNVWGRKEYLRRQAAAQEKTAIAAGGAAAGTGQPVSAPAIAAQGVSGGGATAAPKSNASAPTRAEPAFGLGFGFAKPSSAQT